MRFDTVIGLEVHVRLKTATKLFCPCPCASGPVPNQRICPVCTGQPGVLPVLNQEAFRLALLGGLALHSRIPPIMRFDRKNYFYPDLPKGYQITQLEQPLAEGGYVMIGENERIPIVRAHLEEDAGKAVHPTGQDVTLVDLNRAGIPLLEIVSAPVIASPAQARAYLTELRTLLRYAGVSDCEMEQGSLRCDANISLRPSGSSGLGRKTEIKNLNSFKNVERALAFEETRQRGLLEAGEEVWQETRMWLEEAGRTAGMRSKEEVQDYRYFPDPDLPPFPIDSSLVKELKVSLPELPFEKRSRFEKHYGLSPYDARLLCAEREVADFFEETAKRCQEPKEAANWVGTALLRAVKEKKRPPADLPVTPRALAELIVMVREGTLSRQAGGKVFNAMVEEGGGPRDRARALGLEQVSDSRLLEAMVKEVIDKNPGLVEEYLAGKPAVLNALVGQVMKASRGKADPRKARTILLRILSP